MSSIFTTAGPAVEGRRNVKCKSKVWGCLKPRRVEAKCCLTASNIADARKPPCAAETVSISRHYRPRKRTHCGHSNAREV